MSRRTRKIRRENRKLEEQLSYSDRFEVDHVLDVIKTRALSRYERELVRRDLLLMVGEGRARGEAPRQVIGDDPVALGEAIVAALPKPTAKEWVLRILRSLALGAWVWTLIVLVLGNLLHFGSLIPAGMMRVRLFDIVYILMIGAGSDLLSMVFNRRTMKRRPVFTVGSYIFYIAVIALVAMLGVVYKIEWLIPVQLGLAIIVCFGMLWLILNELVD